MQNTIYNTVYKSLGKHVVKLNDYVYKQMA